MQNEKFRRKPNIQHQDVNILKGSHKKEIPIGSFLFYFSYQKMKFYHPFSQKE